MNALSHSILIASFIIGSLVHHLCNATLVKDVTRNNVVLQSARKSYRTVGNNTEFARHDVVFLDGEPFALESALTRLEDTGSADNIFVVMEGTQVPLAQFLKSNLKKSFRLLRADEIITPLQLGAMLGKTKVGYLKPTEVNINGHVMSVSEAIHMYAPEQTDKFSVKYKNNDEYLMYNHERIQATQLFNLLFNHPSYVYDFTTLEVNHVNLNNYVLMYTLAYVPNLQVVLANEKLSPIKFLNNNPQFHGKYQLEYEGVITDIVDIFKQALKYTIIDYLTFDNSMVHPYYALYSLTNVSHLEAWRPDALKPIKPLKTFINDVFPDEDPKQNRIQVFYKRNLITIDHLMEQLRTVGRMIFGDMSLAQGLPKDGQYQILLKDQKYPLESFLKIYDRTNEYYEVMSDGRILTIDEVQEVVRSNRVNIVGYVSSPEKEVTYMGVAFRPSEIVDNLALQNPRHLFIKYNGVDYTLVEFRDKFRYNLPNNFTVMQGGTQIPLSEIFKFIDVYKTPQFYKEYEILSLEYKNQTYTKDDVLTAILERSSDLMILQNNQFQSPQSFKDKFGDNVPGFVLFYNDQPITKADVPNMVDLDSIMEDEFFPITYNGMSYSPQDVVEMLYNQNPDKVEIQHKGRSYSPAEYKDKFPSTRFQILYNNYPINPLDLEQIIDFDPKSMSTQLVFRPIKYQGKTYTRGDIIDALIKEDVPNVKILYEGVFYIPKQFKRFYGKMLPENLAVVQNKRIIPPKLIPTIVRLGNNKQLLPKIFPNIIYKNKEYTPDDILQMIITQNPADVEIAVKTKRFTPKQFEEQYKGIYPITFSILFKNQLLNPNQIQYIVDFESTKSPILTSETQSSETPNKANPDFHPFIREPLPEPPFSAYAVTPLVIPSDTQTLRTVKYVSKYPLESEVTNDVEVVDSKADEVISVESSSLRQLPIADGNHIIRKSSHELEPTRNVYYPSASGKEEIFGNYDENDLPHIRTQTDKVLRPENVNVNIADVGPVESFVPPKLFPFIVHDGTLYTPEDVVKSVFDDGGNYVIKRGDYSYTPAEFIDQYQLEMPRDFKIYKGDQEITPETISDKVKLRNYGILLSRNEDGKPFPHLVQNGVIYTPKHILNCLINQNINDVYIVHKGRVYEPSSFGKAYEDRKLPEDFRMVKDNKPVPLEEIPSIVNLESNNDTLSTVRPSEQPSFEPSHEGEDYTTQSSTLASMTPTVAADVEETTTELTITHAYTIEPYTETIKLTTISRDVMTTTLKPETNSKISEPPEILDIFTPSTEDLIPSYDMSNIDDFGPTTVKQKPILQFPYIVYNGSVYSPDEVIKTLAEQNPENVVVKYNDTDYAPESFYDKFYKKLPPYFKIYKDNKQVPPLEIPRIIDFGNTETTYDYYDYDASTLLPQNLDDKVFESLTIRQPDNVAIKDKEELVTPDKLNTKYSRGNWPSNAVILDHEKPVKDVERFVKDVDDEYVYPHIVRNNTMYSPEDIIRSLNKNKVPNIKVNHVGNVYTLPEFMKVFPTDMPENIRLISSDKELGPKDIEKMVNLLDSKPNSKPDQSYPTIFKNNKLYKPKDVLKALRVHRPNGVIIIKDNIKFPTESIQRNPINSFDDILIDGVLIPHKNIPDFVESLITNTPFRPEQFTTTNTYAGTTDSTFFDDTTENFVQFEPEELMEFLIEENNSDVKILYDGKEYSPAEFMELPKPEDVDFKVKLGYDVIPYEFTPSLKKHLLVNRPATTPSTPVSKPLPPRIVAPIATRKTFSTLGLEPNDQYRKVVYSDDSHEPISSISSADESTEPVTVPIDTEETRLLVNSDLPSTESYGPTAPETISHMDETTTIRTTISWTTFENGRKTETTYATPGREVKPKDIIRALVTNAPPDDNVKVVYESQEYKPDTFVSEFPEVPQDVKIRVGDKDIPIRDVQVLLEQPMTPAATEPSSEFTNQSAKPSYTSSFPDEVRQVLNELVEQPPMTPSMMSYPPSADGSPPDEKYDNPQTLETTSSFSIPRTTNYPTSKVDSSSIDHTTFKDRIEDTGEKSTESFPKDVPINKESISFDKYPTSETRDSLDVSPNDSTPSPSSQQTTIYDSRTRPMDASTSTRPERIVEYTSPVIRRIDEQKTPESEYSSIESNFSTTQSNMEETEFPLISDVSSGSISSEFSSIDANFVTTSQRLLTTTTQQPHTLQTKFYFDDFSTETTTERISETTTEKISEPPTVSFTRFDKPNRVPPEFSSIGDNYVTTTTTSERPFQEFTIQPSTEKPSTKEQASSSIDDSYVTSIYTESVPNYSTQIKSAVPNNIQPEFSSIDDSYVTVTTTSEGPFIDVSRPLDRTEKSNLFKPKIPAIGDVNTSKKPDRIVEYPSGTTFSPENSNMMGPEFSSIEEIVTSSKNPKESREYYATTESRTDTTTQEETDYYIYDGVTTYEDYPSSPESQNRVEPEISSIDDSSITTQRSQERIETYPSITTSEAESPIRIQTEFSSIDDGSITQRYPEIPSTITVSERSRRFDSEFSSIDDGGIITPSYQEIPLKTYSSTTYPIYSSVTTRSEGPIRVEPEFSSIGVGSVTAPSIRKIPPTTYPSLTNPIFSSTTTESETQTSSEFPSIDDSSITTTARYREPEYPTEIIFRSDKPDRVAPEFSSINDSGVTTPREVYVKYPSKEIVSPDGTNREVPEIAPTDYRRISTMPTVRPTVSKYAPKIIYKPDVNEAVGTQYSILYESTPFKTDVETTIAPNTEYTVTVRSDLEKYKPLMEPKDKYNLPGLTNMPASTYAPSNAKSDYVTKRPQSFVTQVTRPPERLTIYDKPTDQYKVSPSSTPFESIRSSPPDHRDHTPNENENVPLVIREGNIYDKGDIVRDLLVNNVSDVLIDDQGKEYGPEEFIKQHKNIVPNDIRFVHNGKEISPYEVVSRLPPKKPLFVPKVFPDIIQDGMKYTPRDVMNELADLDETCVTILYNDKIYTPREFVRKFDVSFPNDFTVLLGGKPVPPKLLISLLTLSKKQFTTPSTSPSIKESAVVKFIKYSLNIDPNYEIIYNGKRYTPQEYIATFNNKASAKFKIYHKNKIETPKEYYKYLKDVENFAKIRDPPSFPPVHYKGKIYPPRIVVERLAEQHPRGVEIMYKGQFYTPELFLQLPEQPRTFLIIQDNNVVTPLAITKMIDLEREGRAKFIPETSSNKPAINSAYSQFIRSIKNEFPMSVWMDGEEYTPDLIMKELAVENPNKVRVFYNNEYYTPLQMLNGFKQLPRNFLLVDPDGKAYNAEEPESYLRSNMTARKTKSNERNNFPEIIYRGIRFSPIEILKNIEANKDHEIMIKLSNGDLLTAGEVLKQDPVPLDFELVDDGEVIRPTQVARLIELKQMS